MIPGQMPSFFTSRHTRALSFVERPLYSSSRKAEVIMSILTRSVRSSMIPGQMPSFFTSRHTRALSFVERPLYSSSRKAEVIMSIINKLLEKDVTVARGSESRGHGLVI